MERKRKPEIHALSSAVIGTFAFAHVANHLAGLVGIGSHVAFMEAFRRVYRLGLVEVVLLASVAVQILSGAALVARGWGRRRGLVPLLQAASGGYLAIFLLIHVGAVLSARWSLHLDTNFYFAAAGLHVEPFKFFFFPYYFLAVTALFTHIGCVVGRRFPAEDTAKQAYAALASTALGVVLSLLIVLTLAGFFFQVDIPAKYMATFGH